MPAKMTAKLLAARRAGVAVPLLHIGAVNPTKLESGANLPDLHSPFWAPELSPHSLCWFREVTMLMDLLGTNFRLPISLTRVKYRGG
jgi:hypothetical protein